MGEVRPRETIEVFALVSLVENPHALRGLEKLICVVSLGSLGCLPSS